MSENIKVAIISAVSAVVVALITQAATVWPAIRKTGQEAGKASVASEKAASVADSAASRSTQALALAGKEAAQRCPVRSSGDHAKTFDLSKSAGNLIVVSVNGRGNLGRNGGARVVLQAQVEIAGQLKARDTDFRSGRNLDNENNWGASATHIFEATRETQAVTASVTKDDPNGSLSVQSEIHCLAIPIRR